ncbi:hypothetical protein A3A93_01645 [Candidatus Roizmanbacteria bacterium RIFCSPLOWO2_01_FULL_38_12]|uniref:Thioredoxin domain-containing protein n=1 Tax=Candidatus Roizmanbacteria bacterium RIFCSPLOWO2_01_FULL_38_12 TaxID=1802061 RepID=A0A1F7IY85_9BACT|nr:MAG: hypothetical protein A2861_02360 [Candidatus Roizmanbacteria bacterium RIFCSPHIGHO2_01_FULL_38_15]OGK34494.1 MAG: hypothetical protein A3F59_04170 [Candidatus Roizmanbacteria bacterium RIFCSPHIGHO2_12_FULL_38_13]OGK48323.1 MAG: hypothetical protein A3A93_01645 [Candidatus Roizmanbacteria bacterium RIFCSPLOWO2_01_FULL_38_12]
MVLKKSILTVEQSDTKSSNRKSGFDANKLIILALIAVLGLNAYTLFKVNKLEAKQNTIVQAGEPANQPPPQPPQDLSKMPKVMEKDHIRGDINAKILLVEYSDLECPFCKRFHTTMQQVTDEYGSDVAWVYRHFPLSFHQNAQKEDEAAECVGELGGNDAFFSYIDKIFERTTSNGTGFALDQLRPLAEEVGIDGTKFQSCLDSGKYAKHIQDEMVGGTDAGVQGTPGTVIVTKDGKRDFIGGAFPFEDVKRQIDALL